MSSRSPSPVPVPPREARPAPPVETVRLLTDDFALSAPFCRVLARVFRKYAAMNDLPVAPPTEGITDAGPEEPKMRHEALTRAQLNRFALDTNGKEMDDDTFKEIAEFLTCVTIDGAPALTYKGFVQLYQLQTENDINETWADLTRWGYDRQLQLISESAAANAEVPKAAKEDLDEVSASATAGGKKKNKRKKKKKSKKTSNEVSAASGAEAETDGDAEELEAEESTD